MKCNMIYRLITQSETRYLHDVIALSRVVGLNGLIVNAALDTSGVQTEVLNVYAAGRFSRNLDLTPGQVIHEFASLIATSQSAGTLTDVLKFVENRRSWEASIPEQFQLAPFASGFSNAKAAMEALGSVRPNANLRFPLPITPREYIRRLKIRLSQLVAEER